MAEKMNAVGWFEIPTTDLDRAGKFYETVFGLKLHKEEMGPMKMAQFPMQDGIYGSGGSLVLAEGYTPSRDGTVVYFSVKDIEGTLAKITANKGRVLLPKMGIGKYGFIAQFEDSEGNRVALHSME